MPRVLPTGAEAVLARQAARGKIALLDLQTMDGTQYFWSDYPGVFPSLITGANQSYSPWIKKAGPFRRSKDMSTDAGDIIVQNLSGNSIERDVAKAVTGREFDGAFAVLRFWLPQLDAAIDEYHGYLSDQKPSSEEFRFRLLQLMDAAQYDVADEPEQDLCTFDFKSAQCGSVGSATACGKRFKLDCQDPTRAAQERFNGILVPAPGTVLRPPVQNVKRGGGCFSGNTIVVVERFGRRLRLPYDEINLTDLVFTRAGKWRPIEDLHIHDFSGLMLDMGGGELVTAEHELAKARGEFQEARYRFDRATQFAGKIYNLTVATKIEEERNYLLGNGWWAHNKKDARG